MLIIAFVPLVRGQLTGRAPRLAFSQLPGAADVLLIVVTAWRRLMLSLAGGVEQAVSARASTLSAIM